MRVCVRGKGGWVTIFEQECYQNVYISKYNQAFIKQLNNQVMCEFHCKIVTAHNFFVLHEKLWYFLPNIRFL